MSNVHTSLSQSAHDYTQEDAPWILDSENGATEQSGRLGRYLSGGGVVAFGRTIRQELANIKQERFLIRVGFLAFLWLLFYIF